LIVGIGTPLAVLSSEILIRPPGVDTPFRHGIVELSIMDRGAIHGRRRRG
jgi:hypothetical protein